MTKEEKVVRYYVMCNGLKNEIRTGWKDWHVERERVESVAEHIFGVQMLAIAMKSEYQYDVDLYKVIMMIAVHELEEIFIGDLTQFQITKAEKVKIGHEAIEKVLNGLTDKDEIKRLIFEFDERQSNDAKFAHYCDKLECDLQVKLYDEEGCVDLKRQEGNNTLNDARVKELFNSDMSWSEMWLTFDQKVYHYDANFTDVSNYIINHKIS